MSRIGSGLLALQVMVATAAVALLAFTPPSIGRTLLVPVTGTPIGPELLGQLSLSQVSPGPLPGSIIVDGPGRMLAGTLLQQGILMVGAPAALCNTERRKA